MSSQPASVLIVGGGLSGTLAAVHLLRAAACPPDITLLNATPAFGHGLAYRSNDDNLLLNVPAGNMSAFAGQPMHFVRFCQRIDPAIGPGSFVSRRLYGRYLAQCLQDAAADNPGRLRTVVGEATAIHALPDRDGFTVRLAAGDSLAARHVVLALGHQAPRFPLPLTSAARERVIDPWDFERMDRLPGGAPVLVLGTGHTAVDALFHLTRQAQPRPVWMVSRHGLLPQAHRINPNPPPGSPYPDYVGPAPLRIRTLMHRLRQEMARQARAGHDWRDVLNQLRPHTPQLWHAMPVAERRRFLRHAAAFWDVHRHRLAPLAADRLQSLQAAGHVQVLAARLTAVRHAAQNTPALEVDLKLRGQAETQTLAVAAVVNCTGPGTAIGPDSQPLLRQLAQDGLLAPDPCGLGLQVDDQHQVIDARGHPVDGLWYAGPMLKARDWEATAAPELRVCTQRLAERIAACIVSSISIESA